MIRPFARRSELSTYPQICQQVQALTEASWAAIAIAQALSDANARWRADDQRIAAIVGDQSAAPAYLATRRTLA